MPFRFPAFILMILSLSALAQPNCDVLFAGLYFERDFYHQNRCADNAHKLVNRLIENGMPAEKIRVVYFLYEQYRGNAIPILYESDLEPRAGRPRSALHRWPRHVVVEVDGKIYDFDYRPEPVPAREYFKVMFAQSYHHPEGGLEDHIRVRVVPATRNREEFWFKGGDDGRVVQVLGNRKDEVPGLPVEVARDWLNRIAP